MNNHDIQEKLVLWTVFSSRITDLRLRAFAACLCRDFDPEAGETSLTMAEYGKRLGISHHSVWNYTQELMASGEWSISTKPGRATSYIPKFVEEALSDGKSKQHGAELPSVA